MKSYDLQELEKESRGVFNEDGLLYVAVGLLVFCVGASFAFRPLLILVGLGFFLFFPLEAVRRRVTYPRLGYAKFSIEPGTVWGIIAFAIVTFVVLMAIILLGDGRFHQFLPLVFSIVFALGFYFGMSTQGLQAVDVLLILVMLIVGLAASLLFTDWHEGTAVSFTITGLIFIIFGLWKFVHFLRTVPLLDQEGLE